MRDSFVYQLVDLYRIAIKLFESVRNGEAMSGHARVIGGVTGPAGRRYTMAIIVTSDEDTFFHDPEYPELEGDTLLNGKGMIYGPAGCYTGAKVMDPQPERVPEDY